MHETIPARAAGAEVLGVSLVTNMAAGITGEPLSHVEVLETGRAEFVNGSRLVYGLEPGAMRYLNLLGNIWWKGDKLKLMQQLRTWTPDKYRLCMRCLKYRPKARKFWIGVRSDGDFSVGRRRRWAQGIGPNICPECNDWQRGKGDPMI